MIGTVLAYSALFVAALSTLFTRSRLAFSVFVFLIAWEVKDLVLKYYGIYYVGESVFFGITIDAVFLCYILETNLKCKITPIVTTASAVYGLMCLAGEYFGTDVMMGQYGLVCGLSAILAALEGIYDGRNKHRTGLFDFWVFDHLLLLLHSSKAHKER